MRVTKLITRGLKAHDVSVELGPVTLLAGENGSGKSTVFQALRLLAFGQPAEGDAGGISKTNDGIMSLARENSVEIMATLQEGDQTWTVKRSWKRSAGGVTQQVIDLGGLGRANGIREKEALLRDTLGRLLEAWTPRELVTESPAKLRKRLLDLIPRTQAELSKFVPDDCPEWALPEVPTEHPLDWATSAVQRAKDRVKSEKQETERLKKTLQSYEDAWQEPPSDKDVRAQLKVLQEELAGAKSRERDPLADLRGRLGLERDKLAHAERVLADNPEAGIEAAEQDARCPHCGGDLTDLMSGEADKLRARRDGALEAVKLAKTRVAELEMDLEFAEDQEAEKPVMKVRELDAIRADIGAAQTELQRIGSLQARHEQRKEHEYELEVSERAHDELKGWVKRFEELHHEVLVEAAGWLEGRLSGLLGAQAQVRLFDDKGRATCELLVENVPVSARSGGEVAWVLAALVMALSGESEARYRPLLVDGFEAVSASRRGAFVEQVLTQVQEGHITQAILAGCMDSVPSLEGVQLIRFGEAEEVAA